MPRVVKVKFKSAKLSKKIVTGIGGLVDIMVITMVIYKLCLSKKTIKASEFKAKCLHLMDQVAEKNQELVITKNHQPVAKLVPYRNKTKDFIWC